jgi:predicted nucleic acid-binding protein
LQRNRPRARSPHQVLSTTVVSERMRPEPNPGVDGFVQAAPREALFTSVIVVGEILLGIRRLPEGARKARLFRQFSFLRSGLGGRVLPVGAQTAELWADIRSGALARGTTIPVIDALIAASAIEHEFTIVTRNARDFAAAGAKVLNPWTYVATTAPWATWPAALVRNTRAILSRMPS